jgi:hypothetical protein
MIDLESLPMWLACIDERKVPEHVRPKLIRYQKEVKSVLAAHFFGTARPPALPAQPPAVANEFISAAVSVLTEIRDTLTGFHTRTVAVESGLDHLRDKTDVLESRLTEVEAWQRDTVKLTPAPLENWMSLSQYCRIHGIDHPKDKLIAWGKQIRDLAASMNVRAKKEYGYRYTVYLYPESVLAVFFTQTNEPPPDEEAADDFITRENQVVTAQQTPPGPANANVAGLL